MQTGKLKTMKPVNKAVPQAAKQEGFESDDPLKIQTGMQVVHLRFGKGKVINLEGEFPNRKATVFFSDHGQKQLLLKFAKLKIQDN